MVESTFARVKNLHSSPLNPHVIFVSSLHSEVSCQKITFISWSSYVFLPCFPMAFPLFHVFPMFSHGFSHPPPISRWYQDWIDSSDRSRQQAHDLAPGPEVTSAAILDALRNPKPKTRCVDEWDLMGFYSDLMGLNGSLMGFEW